MSEKYGATNLSKIVIRSQHLTFWDNIFPVISLTKGESENYYEKIHRVVYHIKSKGVVIVWANAER